MVQLGGRKPCQISYMRITRKYDTIPHLEKTLLMIDKKMASMSTRFASMRQVTFNIKSREFKKLGLRSLIDQEL